MTVFLTGATGYLGSYVADLLLHEHGEPLALLVRAGDRSEAEQKLWKAWQLHMDAERFYAALDRCVLVYGDLTAPGLGIEAKQRQWLVEHVDSVLHVAATLNRKSEKACLNTNLRGTLSVIKLARAIADHKGLQRFGFVSTTAVAGQRNGEVVTEDEAIDWSRSDYDPYARTKKFSEHMVRELLPDVPFTIYRPSTAMGDSRFPETPAFDMVWPTCVIADLPAAPVHPDTRLDFVNSDFVARAMVTLHMKDRPEHDTYHLSMGTRSSTARDVVNALHRDAGVKPTRLMPGLQPSFATLANVLASSSRKNAVTHFGSLVKVFLPYFTNDTVFDNTRVTQELGLEPVPFSNYCGALYRFAKRTGFQYPYEPLPPRRAHVADAQPASQPVAP